MANRFPLILDTTDSNKLKELPNGDNLDLTGSGISAVGDITSTGTTTAKSVKLSGYTTAERDALSPVEGQMIYNTSTDTFQGYLGTAWQSFSSGLTTAELSIVTSTPTGGGALSYNSNSGVFTFSPAATAAQTLTLNSDNLQISGGNTISLASLPLAYTNITSKPTTLAGYGITNGQQTLVSGTNIKTINGNSLLGSGDIQIQGGSGSDAPMNFSVGADDSTLRQISTGESIRFIGGTGIDTTSDAEGNITITSNGSITTITTPTINLEKVGSTEPQLTITSETNTGGFGTGIIDIFNNHTGTYGQEITFHRSNGTNASPTAVQSGDFSGSVTIRAHDGSSYSTIGAMHVIAERVGGVNDIDSIIRFLTRNGSTSDYGTALKLGKGAEVTGYVQFGSYTTTTRNALTAANGMIIYNTTENKFQGYENGSWADIRSAAGTGDVTFSGTTIDSNDSSGIVFTPTVTTNSDLIVQNDIRCSNVVYAESFQSTGTGAPAFTSNSSITLSAVDRINVTRGPVNQASFTTVDRDALSSVNGDVIYNTTANTFQGYANGSWTPLSGHVEHTFNLGASGVDHYVFSDTANHWFPTSENDPTLYLRRGETYIFNNTSGSHPFRIQSTTGLSGTPYNTGVTNNGTVGVVTFKVPMSAPATLYYQCTSHTNMNGTINIV